MNTTLTWIKEHKTWLLLACLLVGAALRVVGLGSVPPGLHFDEAVYGLMAEQIRGGYRPVFFSAYTGREPLYMYIMAGVFELIGSNVLGLRLTSALIGTVTLWLTYLLFTELFPERTPRLALLTTALTAIAYWHVTVSRNGYPNIAIPPLECLALLFLWRGYRDNHKGWMALGGAFIGLVLYTYLAARLFPITVALFFIYTFLVDRERFLSRFWGLALAALVAALVFAPLGLYFLRNPHDFWERANQVLATRKADGWRLLVIYSKNLLETLGGFFLRGEPRQHYNIPGRPVFDPLMAVFFLLGVAMVVKRWRTPRYALLPIWVLGMSLPAILTAEPMPQSQRMFGVIPAIFGLAALGLDTALTWIEEREHRGLQRGALVLLSALLLFETGNTVYAYFFNWGRQPATYSTFNTEHILAARKAVEHLEDGEDVVIQSYHYKHPTLVFTEPRLVSEATWTIGGRVFVVPHRDGEAVVYLRMRGNPAHTAITALEARLTDALPPLPDPWGGEAVTRRRLKPGVREQELAQEVQMTFTDEVGLLDATVPETLARDEQLQVLVHWRALRAVAEPRDMRVHLVDSNGVLWSQSGGGDYLTEQWRAGDSVYQLFQVPLPEGIPAGPYQVRLLLSREGGGQLPVFREGEPIGVTMPLGTVTLLPQGRLLRPVDETGTRFGEALAAREHDVLSGAFRPGSRLQFGVTWQALQKPETDYAFRLTFIDAAGATQAVIEAPLAHEYPTSDWEAGEVVRTVTRVRAPSLPDGDYRLALTVAGLSGTLDLGQITLGGVERLFEPPPISQPLQATFGDSIALLGYDLPEGKRYPAGAAFPLRLYWKALDVSQSEYKVFVHVIDEKGQIWGQDDSVPAGWTRPTPGWVTGEIVIDEHLVPLKEDIPPGTYQIAVGMYDAETLQRLPLVVEKGTPLSEDRLALTSLIVEE
ncbi:MAG: ArnT family glycosyltransferase [Anaerolineae bacterium]